MDRYAVLADIHGNIWALDAVMQDIHRRGIESIINLGDAFYGPLEPGATAEVLISSAFISVCGNQDRTLLEAQNAAISPTLAFVLKELPSNTLDWLAGLPANLVVDDLFLCHGTPDADNVYLLEQMALMGNPLSPDAVIMEKIGTVTQQVILCGHSHLPRVVCVDQKFLIVNPGSVGLPAYNDELPVPHSMQTGSPYAHYAVITRLATGWQVEQVVLPYAWEKAARAAHNNGRQDWAAWLASGRA